MSLILAFVLGMLVVYAWGKIWRRIARSSYGAKQGWRKDAVLGWLRHADQDDLLRHKKAVDDEVERRRA